MITSDITSLKIYFRIYLSNDIFINFSDSKLNIGLITRSTLRHLFSEGDISEYEQQQFHKGVLCFYISALDYATSRLPLKDRVLENAQFTNVTNRLKADIMQVFYFAERYWDSVVFQLKIRWLCFYADKGNIQTELVLCH